MTFQLLRRLSPDNNETTAKGIAVSLSEPPYHRPRADVGRRAGPATRSDPPGLRCRISRAM
eukprot:249239-Hanusia_phi.AAC.1